MKYRTLATGAALTLATIVAASPAAQADQGNGAFTYSEWVQLWPGLGEASVKIVCGSVDNPCTGTVHSGPADGKKVVWYDFSYYPGGTVRVHYSFTGGQWVATAAPGCDANGVCIGDPSF